MTYKEYLTKRKIYMTSDAPIAIKEKAIYELDKKYFGNTSVKEAIVESSELELQDD